VKIESMTLAYSVHLCDQMPAPMQVIMQPRVDVNGHDHAVDEMMIDGVKSNRIGQRANVWSCVAHLRQVFHGTSDCGMKLSLGFLAAF
jgi:hypothetical protein